MASKLSWAPAPDIYILNCGSDIYTTCLKITYRGVWIGVLSLPGVLGVFVLGLPVDWGVFGRLPALPGVLKDAIRALFVPLCLEVVLQVWQVAIWEPKGNTCINITFFHWYPYRATGGRMSHRRSGAAMTNAHVPPSDRHVSLTADVYHSLRGGQGGVLTKADDSVNSWGSSCLPNIPEIFAKDRKITGLVKAGREKVTCSIRRRRERLLLCSVAYSWYGFYKSRQPTLN